MVRRCNDNPLLPGFLLHIIMAHFRATGIPFPSNLPFLSLRDETAALPWTGNSRGYHMIALFGIEVFDLFPVAACRLFRFPSLQNY